MAIFYYFFTHINPMSYDCIQKLNKIIIFTCKMTKTIYLLYFLNKKTQQLHHLTKTS